MSFRPLKDFAKTALNFMDKILLKKFILISVILVLIFGIAYFMARQILRQGADDPQIQIAEDSAAILSRGEEPDFIRSNVYGQVDLAKSLAPFLITYDRAGKPLSSTGILDGKTPTPPAGVFASAKKHGENRLTWQPKKGVRIAMVLVYYGGAREGYVLSGRSLLEVEKREGIIEKIAVFGALASLFIVFIIFFALDRRRGLTQ